MISLENDYAEGAHEKVLQALTETNFTQLSGYGFDTYTAQAKEKIRKAFQMPDADIHFLVGGTQTNQVVIASLLHSYEGVLCAATGHINSHEAGAIELSGHKVMALPEQNGKLNPADVEQALRTFYADANHEHMVFPGMVYISHPTEYGTLYIKAELTALHDICRQYHIPLYMDGARLGYGLMSRDTDVTAADIPKLVDVFYIGGTKVGALCGEALVFCGSDAPAHFPTIIKQHGAMLAKGRLTGVQFDALFTDDLYFRIANHAIAQAEKLKAILRKHNVPFQLVSPTNQQFVIMENSILEKFGRQVAYAFWEQADDNHTVIRLATSWCTTDETLDTLDTVLSQLFD